MSAVQAQQIKQMAVSGGKKQVSKQKQTYPDLQIHPFICSLGFHIQTPMVSVSQVYSTSNSVLGLTPAFQKRTLLCHWAIIRFHYSNLLSPRFIMSPTAVMAIIKCIFNNTTTDRLTYVLLLRALKTAPRRAQPQSRRVSVLQESRKELIRGSAVKGLSPELFQLWHKTF